MFDRARIKLTVVYSAIFLVLFWSFSLGIYLWMNRYFGDKPGQDTYVRVHHERSLIEPDRTTTEPVSDIVMDELRNVLFIFDGLLLLSIPAITWFLTGRTLAPVKVAHEKEKQFLTDASHDLRTPLSTLKSEIELVLKKGQTTDVYKQTLQSNKEEVEELIDLVENMLFFARSNTQSVKSEKQKVDLVDLLAERIAAIQPLANQKQQQLSIQLPEQAITIWGNAQLLKRLFTSLLDNAIKYTPEGGRISVTIKEVKQSIHVTISDTGIGISKAEHAKVFDRFYRVDASRKEKGYGLGLSIAKEIMQFHSGEIQLESREGKGTSVTLLFPVV